jgi:hypothetical protein
MKSRKLLEKIKWLLGLLEVKKEKTSSRLFLKPLQSMRK